MGLDFTGLVEAVGPGVELLKVGTAVFGLTSLRQVGALDDYVAADKKGRLAQATFRPVRAGRRHVPGGGGGLECAGGQGKTGGWPIDLHLWLSGRCRTFGGATYPDVRRADRRQLQCSGTRCGTCVGVDEVVDFRTFDAASFRQRFDVVSDTSGALTLRQCGAMLKPCGMSLHINPTTIRMIGCLLSSRHYLVFGNPSPQCLEGVAEAAELGKLIPAIGRTVPLSEAARSSSNL
jgi:NADPH:quinone reductase-like Zn-dependent oxidoreductase